MSASSNAGRIGIWGRSGAGKSTFAKKRLKGQKRIVVFDPLDEYGPRGDKICTITVHSLPEVLEAMKADWRGFKIAFVPRSGQEPRYLSALCRLLLKAQQPFKDTGKGAGITLVVEEMNLSFPVHGGEAKSPGFAEICSRGRHYGIEVIGLSQRIAEVSLRFRGNCTESIVLAQASPRDVEAAFGVLKFKRSEKNAGIDMVDDLKNFEFIHFQADGTRKTGKLAKR
ncbi:MAG: hypothetical protein ACRBBO_05940 [Cognatishimia sp.]